MHHLRRLRRTPVLVCCVVALGMAAAGIAYAAIPDSGGVIHACYLKSAGAQPQGALRVIDSGKGQVCKTTETALNFNQKGQKGQKGATGATGPAGPAGPKGAAGARGPDGVNDAWWSSQLNLDDIAASQTSQLPMFQSNLVPGTYLLNLTSQIVSWTLGDPGEIDCLVDGADEQAIQMVTQEGLAVPSLGELTVTTAENPQIICENLTGGPVGVQVYATATRVADLH